MPDRITSITGPSDPSDAAGRRRRARPLWEGAVAALVALAPLHAQVPSPGAALPAVQDRVPAVPAGLPEPRPIARGRSPLPPQTVLGPLPDPGAGAQARAAGGLWLGPTRRLPAGIEIAPDSSDALAGHGRWTQVGRRRFWRATIRSPGARALRVKLASFDTAGEVYLYALDPDVPHVGPYSGLGPAGTGAFWSEIIPGDSVTVEYAEDSSGQGDATVPFRVEGLAHLLSFPGRPSKPGFREPAHPLLPPSRSVAPCHLDVSCYPEWQDRDHPSTVQLLVTSGDGSRQCTGSLLNPRYGVERHLLLLTAGHCVSSDEEAASAIFTWNFQTDRCDALAPPPEGLARTSGAQLLATRNDFAGDFALLRLDPAVVRQVTGWTSLGWDPDRAAPGTPVVAVSHPAGSHKRVAFGTATDTSWTGLRSGTFSGVRWHQGSKEAGSSGAGVRRESDGRLIGIVTGGLADLEPCDPEQLGVLVQFEAIYGETRDFFESEAAVRDSLPERPTEIRVPLGGGEGFLTLLRAGDDTYWLDEQPVTEGLEITLPDGRKYRLSTDADGSWRAELLERLRNLGLPNGEVIETRQTADGRYWLGNAEIKPGSGLTHAEHGTYRLRAGAAGEDWGFDLVPAGVPLSAHGLTARIVAGTGERGHSGDGGPASEARLDDPSGVAIDDLGNVYIADTGNHKVRKVDSEGVITAVAGTGEAGFSGDGWYSSGARLRAPRGIAAGPDGWLYIADTGNHRIRAVSPAGVIRTIAGDGGRGYSGDGSPAEAAALSEPAAIALDAAGRILIADSGNHRIRRISQGLIETVAGTGLVGYGGDGGPALGATLRFPKGVAAGEAGSVYVADTGNSRIRRIGPGGLITTLMGMGRRGLGGDGAPAVQADLSIPRGVAASQDGAIYAADTGNNVLRRIAPNGLASSVTATDGTGHGVLGGPAALARLGEPYQVALHPGGSIFVADSRHNRVLALEPEWTLVPREEMPTPVDVRLGGGSGTIGLWRSPDSRHFHAGDLLIGDRVVAGWPFRRRSLGRWDGVSFRLTQSLGLGWTAVPAVLDHWAAAREGRLFAVPGIAEVLFRLGMLYHTVRDMQELPRDHATVLSWLARPGDRPPPEGMSDVLASLRDAAERGSAAAQAALGDILRRYDALGPDEEARHAEAVRWYRLAAEQGHASGQYGLGVVLNAGTGVAEDLPAAARWHRRAALRGHTLAQRELGRMSEDGRGVDASEAVAAHWYRLAALAGEPVAQLSLGWLLILGQSIDADQPEGVRWMRAAANRGYDFAQTGLGWIYENGRGVDHDPAEAVRWYRLSAMQGHAYAQWRLGVAFSEGEGVPRDDVAATVWLGLAVENGERNAFISRASLLEGLTRLQIQEVEALATRCANSEYADCP